MEKLGNLEVFLFDIGGVLIPETYHQICEALSERLGISSEEFRRRKRKGKDLVVTGEKRLVNLYKDVIDELDSRVSAEELIELHLETYKKGIENRDEDVIKIIQRLKRNDYIVGCFSNTEPETAGYNKEIGLFDMFDVSYLSTEIGSRKPDKASFEYILYDLKSAANKIFFTDDRMKNITAANEQGIVAERFQNAIKLESTLRHYLK